MADSQELSADARHRIRVEDAVKSFSGRVVVDVDELVLGEHPVEGLIGPNGAGKTTLMRMIMHSVSLDSGKVTLLSPDSSDGETILSELPSHEMAYHGVVKTNQVIMDFEKLTILDSLLLSVARASDERLFELYREDDVFETNRERILWYLDEFEFADPTGYAKSAGEKKLLDIIRCLLLEPKVLLLDEPTAGLPDDIRDRIMELVRERAVEDNVSVVIVEHDLDVIWNMSDYVHFMAEGSVVLQGDPKWIRDHDTVIEKYLGSEHVGS